MKKHEIKVGGKYVAKVAGKLTTVRVDAMREVDATNGNTTRYDVTNLTTNRKTTFRSAAKFRSVAISKQDWQKKVAEQVIQPTIDKLIEDGVLPKPEGKVEITFPTDTFTLDEEGNEQEDEQSRPPTALPVSVVDTCTDDSRVIQEKNMIVLPAVTPTTSTNPTTSAPSVSADPTGRPVNGLASKLASQFAPTATPHVQVRALAGTGKTTTMVEGMRLLKGQTPAIAPSPQQQAVWDSMKLGKSDSIRFAAFGKAIATELQERLSRFGLDRMGCEASTFHSMGYKAVIKAFGRQEPNKWTVLDITAELMGKDFRDMRRDPQKMLVLNAVDALVGLCKQNLSATDEDSLDALAGHYDVDTNGHRAEIYDLVPRVLEACKQPKGKITFDDMVWLPVVHNLPIYKTDMLLVDEVQDLNRMQQALAYKAAHRIVMVGDENQAIFGFAGADAESMNRMRDHLKAQTLPLTVTRRCGKAIVAEANRYVPEFEAHESNSEGSVGRADYGNGRPSEKTYHNQVQNGDFILCRVNAPLVNQCFAFLKQGRKANIQGRDIGAGLVSTIEKLKATTVPDLIGKLGDWLSKETAKENAKRFPSETRIEALRDRVDCLVCFTEQANEVADVVRKIQSVFTDDKTSAGIKLSSIHRSKGLESKNVFILQPKGVGPREDKMQEWERQQEENLRYVACTRAINTLTYVNDSK